MLLIKKTMKKFYIPGINEAKNQLSDADLLLKIRQHGDNDYLEILFSRYAHLLYPMCEKYFRDEADSKDAVMEILEKVIIELQLKEVNNFKNWIYSVTRNHCLMKLRKDKQTNDIFQSENKFSKEFMESAHFLHLLSEGSHDNEEIDKAIGALKEEQRTCLKLFFFENKSYNEVAQSTGYTVNKVKSNIQNGKRNLKKILLEKQD